MPSRSCASRLFLRNSLPHRRRALRWFGIAETQQGVLKVSNIPANAQDRDYQLWIVDPGKAQPVDGGTFHIDKAGSSDIPFQAKAHVRAADAFAVSLERKGGVPKAEGPMVLLGK